MGFKSAKNTNNVNQSNGKYEVDGVIFPSRFVFTTIESLDRNLRFFYSPAPPNRLGPRINYSAVRDDEEEFNCILDRVEELISRIEEEVDNVEIVDELFYKLHGIIDFLREADDFLNKEEDDLSKRTPEYIQRRFIKISFRMLRLGFRKSNVFKF